MKLLKRSFFILLAVFMFAGASAQQSNLHMLGVGMNRFGFSFNYKFYKASDPDRVWTRGDLLFDLGNILSPREQIAVNQTLTNPGVYKLGKINYAWTLRNYYMLRRQISTRQDRKNVALNAVFGAGIPVCYYWPVYINYFDPNAGPNGTTTQERYDPEIHKQSQIIGRTAFTKGIHQGTILPGAGLNAGLEFIWGNYRSDVKVLTIGARLEGYGKKIPIMYRNDLNSQLYSMFYINFALGFGNN